MSQSVNVDSPKTIISAIILGTVGVFAFIVQPGLVQAFISDLGINEASANGLAAWEMGGIALSTILAAVVSNHISWRKLMTLSICVAMLGNLLSAFIATPETLSFTRFITGLGAGGIIALSFSIVGLTSNPERNLAFYLTLLLIYGALGLWLIQRTISTIGLQGVFLVWAFLTALSLLTVRHLPTSADSRDVPSPTAVQFGLGFLIIALIGILAYNTAIGLAWANLFLIGLEIKPDEQAVANALLLSQFIAIPGAVTAALISERVGRWVPYIIGILGGMLAIYSLTISPKFIGFIIAVCAFNFLWNMVLPFILSAVNDMDKKSRMVTPAISMQMIGLFAGPFFGAILLGKGVSFNNIEWVIVTMFFASFVILSTCLWMHAKRLKSAN